MWKTPPSPNLFLSLDLLGIRGKTEYNKQVWICLEVHAVSIADLAWPASYAMGQHCSALKVSDFQESIFWRNSFQMKLLLCGFPVPPSQFFWRKKGKKKSQKGDGREDAMTDIHSKWGEENTGPSFLWPYCPLPGHSLYLSAYLSGQCSPLKSLLLVLSIQQGGSIAQFQVKVLKLAMAWKASCLFQDWHFV